MSHTPREVRSALLLAAVLCAAAPSAPAPRSARGPTSRLDVARGVTFTIDTTADVVTSGADAAAGRLFTRYAAVVTAVPGRGRLDVRAAAPAPASVAGLTIVGPAARPGDYYLFDSTGVVLVRPGERTYARLRFSDYGVGGADDRTGWPSAMFPLTPIRVAPGRAGAAAPMRDLAVFWHLDLDQHTSEYNVIARGRLRGGRLPLGEVGVVRWFGPADALARLPAATVARAASRLGITAVTPVPAAGGLGGVIFSIQHAVTAPRAVDVDLSRLALPAGYTERAWPTGAASGR